LRDLERRFPGTLAVIGVHSGKYHTERVTARIREAANRLGNDHPIVNDRQFRVWRGYAVTAWPTIVIIDPTGRVLGQHAGEFTADELAPVLERMVEPFEAAGHLVRGEAHAEPDPPERAPGTLRYPGKVAVDGGRIAIADSGHHRILAGRLTSDGRGARIERIIGGPEAGLADGAAEEARFRDPQGMAFDGDRLFVADAGNHAIRVVHLGMGEVATVAGTGAQLRTMDDLRAGALSSPWDVALAAGTLYVAMAGIHQLWALDLAARTGRPHSGTRAEAIVDGRHGEAALAQPMGLAADGERIWFVDAESSAVRWADCDPRGGVGTVVGTGLFDFGDRDGVGDDARLQHPQGIARHPDGRLLVADSYNDALRWVDPASRRVETWVRGLHEPAGVALGARHAYVADTNAHRIAWVELASGEVGEVRLEV
jgi:hypothetical protein